MSLSAAVGVGQASDGNEAALVATRQALDKMGKTPTVFAMVFSSFEYPIQAVLAGASTLLANIPIWGISTILPLMDHRYLPRSVIVVLIAGSDIKVQTGWFPEYSSNPHMVASQLLPSLLDAPPPVSNIATTELLKNRRVTTGNLNKKQSTTQKVLFLAMDGTNGNAAMICTALRSRRIPVVGCLSSSKSQYGKSYQIAGNQAGTGGLAAAVLNGNFRLGTGLAHGWQPVGPFYKATLVKDNKILEMDGDLPAQVYSQILGHTIREWVTPPLNELIRLYPLGIEELNSLNWVIRSPLRVDVDGGLLMNAPIREGSVAHLLVGSVQSCIKAAQLAAQQALSSIQFARPVLAMVFADSAWQMLMEPEGNPEIQAIQAIIGSDIPIVGGYTLGQFARSDFNQPLPFLNQHIEVVLLGNPEPETVRLQEPGKAQSG